MATMGKQKMRSLQRCIRSVESFSDGQARIVDWTDDLSGVRVEIQPKDGVYKEKKPTFVFNLKLPSSFPQEPPEVTCTTAIYHPNIDPYSQSSNVCLNLFDEWQPKFGLDDVIQGLLFLLYNPNLEDPLSPFFDGSNVEEDEYEENVQKSLDGEVVESFDFGDPGNSRNAERDSDDEEEAENEDLQWVKPTEEAKVALGEQYVEGDDDEEDEEGENVGEEEGATGGVDATTEDKPSEPEDDGVLTLQRMLSADFGISAEQMLSAEIEVTSPAILAAEDETTNLLNQILSGQVTCNDEPLGYQVPTTSSAEQVPLVCEPSTETDTGVQDTGSPSQAVTSMNELNLRRNLQADDTDAAESSQVAARPSLSRQASKPPAIIAPDGEIAVGGEETTSVERTLTRFLSQTSVVESKWKCVLVSLCCVAIGAFYRLLRRR